MPNRLQFHLQFRQEVKISIEVFSQEDAQSSSSPFDVQYRYQHTGLDIKQKHYNLYSMQLDRYETLNDAEYSLGISVHTDAYVLIAFEQGNIHYHLPPQSTHKVIPLFTNQCCLFYITRGKYTVQLIAPQNLFYVISFAPQILYPFRSEFDELIAFMDNPRKQALAAMDSRNMDSTFIQRLHRFIYTPFARYKDYNIHLFRELPAVLSAYKGLLLGKDRLSLDQQTADGIIKYIQDKLTFGHNVTVSSLQATFHISRRKLEGIFLEYIHTTPSVYIRQQKIRLICELLLTTDRSLLELALQYGYSDISSLDRTFKQIMGLSMHQYRLRNRK